ncbi:DNA-binding protein [Hymenobacter sp. H14-R3]|uniref:PPC domain-containing DNA-binding protein n=1 Tax=Hymenobacter sp. H14-R3 TaxID=3046308 RepID=UPI0024BA50A8|nr:PPC domain-containing DNA-binding protein [Hymenobacter sp. H14-R3]MDJ0363705.1 DNA-binding protein [Hymenobacter sp. H14-R3]
MLKPILLLGLGLLASPAHAQTHAAMVPSSALTAYALRLKPGDDLRQQLTAFVTAHHLEAGAMLTCVGSLTEVSLRLANQENATHYHGHFEIVSLVGTLSATGGGHLHLAVADSTGRTLGGHLLDGCRVYTTAEIVLGALPALQFVRETDPTFGYQELVVKPAPAAAAKKR